MNFKLFFTILFAMAALSIASETLSDGMMSSRKIETTKLEYDSLLPIPSDDGEESDDNSLESEEEGTNDGTSNSNLVITIISEGFNKNVLKRAKFAHQLENIFPKDDQTSFHAKKMKSHYPPTYISAMANILLGVNVTSHGIFDVEMFDRRENSSILLNNDDNTKTFNTVLYSQDMFNMINASYIPIWAANQKKGGKTACYSFNLCEFEYNNMTVTKNIELIENATLEEEIVHIFENYVDNDEEDYNLILYHTNEPAQSAKLFGIDSSQYKNAVASVINMMNKLNDLITSSDSKQRINLIFASDNAIVGVDDSEMIFLDYFLANSRSQVIMKSALVQIKSFDDMKKIERKLSKKLKFYSKLQILKSHDTFFLTSQPHAVFNYKKQQSATKAGYAYKPHSSETETILYGKGVEIERIMKQQDDNEILELTTIYKLICEILKVQDHCTVQVFPSIIPNIIPQSTTTAPIAETSEIALIDVGGISWSFVGFITGTVFAFAAFLFVSCIVKDRNNRRESIDEFGDFREFMNNHRNATINSRTPLINETTTTELGDVTSSSTQKENENAKSLEMMKKTVDDETAEMKNNGNEIRNVNTGSMIGKKGHVQQQVTKFDVKAQVHREQTPSYPYEEKWVEPHSLESELDDSKSFNLQLNKDAYLHSTPEKSKKLVDLDETSC